MPRQPHRDSTTVICRSNDRSGCGLKPQYTTAARRHVSRHLREDALNRMNARATSRMMQRRRCAAGHPFDAIKQMMDDEQFLTRNLKAPGAGITLLILACNILRAINIGAVTI